MKIFWFLEVHDQSEGFKSVALYTFAQKDLIPTAFREQGFNTLIQALSTGDGFLLFWTQWHLPRLRKKKLDKMLSTTNVI